MTAEDNTRVQLEAMFNDVAMSWTQIADGGRSNLFIDLAKELYRRGWRREDLNNNEEAGATK